VKRCWAQERRRDQFYKLAKEKGFRSRASFKLLQAERSYKFIRRGDFVVDLGAAPGGWLQAARHLVGVKGIVLGVDLKEIKPFPWKNVRAIVGDIFDPNIGQRILEKLGRKADVVISDASPNLTGHWEVDHSRQIHLAKRSLELCNEILRENGNLFLKAFHGIELKDLEFSMRRVFQSFRIVKPPASRAKSSEIYLLGLGYQPQLSPATESRERAEEPLR
jgi:23S rRNA (uridine2552-2'-O)-methyltransferase